MIEIYCLAYAISRLKATDCGGGRGVAAAVKRERWKVFSKFRAKSKCCVKGKETQEAREISCTSTRNCSEIMNHLLLGSLLSPATSEAGAFVCQSSAAARSKASKPAGFSLFSPAQGRTITYTAPPLFAARLFIAAPFHCLFVVVFLCTHPVLAGELLCFSP